MFLLLLTTTTTINSKYYNTSRIRFFFFSYDQSFSPIKFRKKRDYLLDQKNSTQNLLDYNLQIDVCPVPSSTVKNLGVILDSNLSFENHISHVTKTAFFHLRNIGKLRNMLSVSDAEKLVHAFMTSRLDYCNALLGGCPDLINKLQIVQNAAARVLTRSRKYDHINPILQSLHWLPIKFRISYKILLFTYKALNDYSKGNWLSYIYIYIYIYISILNLQVIFVDFF